jgi:hypothetical protein
MSIESDLGWFKTHIVLLAVIVVLTFGGIYGVETIIEKHDADNNSKWQAINQAQVAQVQSLSDKLASEEKDRIEENTRQTAILAQLANTIAQRDKDTAAAVQKDTTLSASEAAQKIAQQTNAQAGEVTAQGDIIQLDLPVARTIASIADQLPAVKADLADTQKQLTAETTIATNMQNNVVGEQELIDAMKVQSQDAEKACKTQIADVKAKARKSKLRWFLVGLITGIIGGHYI